MATSKREPWQNYLRRTPDPDDLRPPLDADPPTVRAENECECGREYWNCVCDELKGGENGY